MNERLLAVDVARDSRMTWIGVGNVEAFLLRADRASEPVRESITLRGGIVGYHLPSLRPAEIPLARGDTLVFATDGLHGGFVDGVDVQASAQDVAGAILARHSRGDDDALVLVARFLGGPT